MSHMRNRERLLKKMAALPAAVRSAIRQALAESADEIVAMQKRLAPVSKNGNHGNPPGALRDSITQTWGARGPAYATLGAGASGDPDLTVRITAGNTRVRYAHLVEFGAKPHTAGGRFKGAQHPGAPAQPFFYPPYRALRRRAKSRINRAVRKAAREVAAKS